MTMPDQGAIGLGMVARAIVGCICASMIAARNLSNKLLQLFPFDGPSYFFHQIFCNLPGQARFIMPCISLEIIASTSHHRISLDPAAAVFTGLTLEIQSIAGW